MGSVMTRVFAGLVLLGAGVGCIGCGKKEPPPVYPITGKVTLGGRTYPRVIMYFRPVSGQVNEFNMGVGETDKDGNLVVRGNIGLGLPVGEYKVTFTYRVMKNGKGAGLTADDKPSELGTETIEMVPASLAESTGNDTTTVRFTVTNAGENVFNFDIPAK